MNKTSKAPLVISTTQDLIQYRDSLSKDTRVGFVPTMGALHLGHGSLIEKSNQNCDITILSIFVNPTQFNNPEDLKKYPRTWEQDLKIAEQCKASVVFAPSYEQIYADNYRYILTENSFSKLLCGAHRPGHFNGVLTVVMKLLQIVNPTYAYFGEKDFQQLSLIKSMCESFFLRTKVIGCSTVREEDGLAMSSRNARLSPEGRAKAVNLYKCLKTCANFDEASAFLKPYYIELEYFEKHENRLYIAAHVDGVRLIDNVAV